MAANIKCPRCGQRVAVGEGQTIFYCSNCRAVFDDDPDEGGDYSDRNPAARLEREERRAAQPKRKR